MTLAIDSLAPLSPYAFVARLRAEGSAGSYDKHPFHLAMHEGRLSRPELRSWVANRYYYQTRIPIIDALILAKTDDPAFRRSWMRRIVDHDGTSLGEGGLFEWLLLARAVGFDDEAVKSCRYVLPAARVACDGYVELVQRSSLVEAVASSLTEFFSPDLIARRIEAWEKHYGWIDPAKLDYFRGRLVRAPVDAREALNFVLAHVSTREDQERCVQALVNKTKILWALFDAVQAGTSRGSLLP